MATALLVVDVQANLFDPAYRLVGAEPLLANLQTLLARARAARAPVVFVRHNGRPGEPDAPGTPGWRLHDALRVAPDEPVIDKRRRDAFHGTALREELAARGVTRLVVAGVQSDYCVQATARRALELGFELVVAADAHATRDSALPALEIVAAVNERFRGRARVVPTAEVAFQPAPPRT